MKTLLFIIWMLFTFLLTCTVIGMLLFIPQMYANGENDPSTWMQLGKKLLADIK